MDISPVQIFARCRAGERMISTCVVPTVKHGWDGVVCFDGDTLCDLFSIQGTLNQHGYNSILKRYALLPVYALLTMTQSTPPGCVRAIWPRRRVMECCIRWPGHHNHLTSTQLRWFGISCTAEWRLRFQQVLRICGNSFKTVGKAFQVKLVEGIPRLC